MKISIDLNDPEVKKQIKNAIEAKLHELTAEHVNAVVKEIVATKADRVTDVWLERAVREVVSAKVAEMFVKKWASPTEFQSILGQVAEKVIREHLSNKSIA